MPNILVLEDDFIFCEFIYEVLTQQGHSVATACNGVDGLEKIKQTLFDVVVTDIDMPLMGGIDFWRHVQGLASGSSVSFVVLSGQPRERILSIENGMSELLFLEKPTTPSKLLATIDRAIARRDLASSATNSKNSAQKSYVSV